MVTAYTSQRNNTVITRTWLSLEDISVRSMKLRHTRRGVERKEMAIAKRPSEIIAEFIELCEMSKTEYAEAEKRVQDFDEKTLAWVHKIENEGKAEKRSKLATAWHEERVARRKEKNRLVLFEKIKAFSSDTVNSGTLKRLRRLLEDQRAAEEYLVSDDKVYKGKKVIERE